MPKLNFRNPITLPIVAVLITLIVIYTTGCSYYKAVSEDSAELAATGLYDDLSTYHTYVHDSTTVFLLTDCTLDTSRLTGKIHTVDTLTAPYFVSDSGKTRVKDYERSIFQEIHFYIDSEISLVQSAESSDVITIPLSGIQEVKLIKLNVTKGIFMALAVLLGVAAVAFGIVLIVAAFTSCPYVYAFDGSEFVFQGEIYSGANAQNLERRDVLHLPAIKEYNNTYSVRISNELREKQFINQMQLAVIEHAADALVVPDQSGEYHIVRNCKAPAEVYTHLGNDISQLVVATDTTYFSFDEPDSSGTTVTITFKNPDKEKFGVMLLDLKNSVWGDYVVGEFQSLFGKRYKHWSKTREKLTHEERIANLDSSGLLLSIYLEQNGNWEFIENLYFVGPMGQRTIAVPLELSPQETEVKVKLYSGYRFWEINQVRIGYDTDTTKSEQVYYPEMINVPTDIENQLAQVDDRYFIQKKTGDFIDLSWSMPNTTKEGNYSIFLECTGYYIPKTRSKGKPDIAQLEKFRRQGYFSFYSYSKYNEATDIPVSIVEAAPPTKFN